MDVFVSLFNGCHNRDIAGTMGGLTVSYHQWCWPDGNPLIDQNRLLWFIFQVIKNEAEAAINSKLNSSGKKGRK